MSDLTKEAILKSNKQKWSLSSKIEADGLEWLYNDPTAQQTNEEKLESYLLGESIPGARGELQKTNELDGSTLGSLLKDESSNRIYEQTLNKFREDPLFIIKKLEMQQKQVLDKYSTIASNFEKKKKELKKYSDRKHNDKDRYSRDKYNNYKHSISYREHRSDRYSRRSEERYKESHRRDRKHRNKSPDKYRNYRKHRHRNRSRSRSRSSSKTVSRSRSKSDEGSRRNQRSKYSSKQISKSNLQDLSPSKDHISESKKVKGPEIPKKYNPLKYAFGVNDDICPPDAILATAKKRELESKSREQDNNQSSKFKKDENELLEEMKKEGTSHIKEKLDNIVKLDLIESVLEKRDSQTKRDYISIIKKQAFETANMAEIIRRKASKQQDPFNENI